MTIRNMSMFKGESCSDDLNNNEYPFLPGLYVWWWTIYIALVGVFNPITSTEQQCQPHPVKQDVDVWRWPVGPQFCMNSHPIFVSMRVPSTSENPGVLVLDHRCPQGFETMSPPCRCEDKPQRFCWALGRRGQSGKKTPLNPDWENHMKPSCFIGKWSTDGVPSGKRSHSELEKITILNRSINYIHDFTWVIFSICNKLPEGILDMNMRIRTLLMVASEFLILCRAAVLWGCWRLDNGSPTTRGWAAGRAPQL